MSRELFVYYRVRVGDAVAARAAVQRLHAGLHAAHPSVHARLLWRDDADGERQTWMETYTADAGIPGELQADIEARAAGLMPLIDGPRHIEVFNACAS